MNHYEIFIALVAPRGINVDTIIDELEISVKGYGYVVKRINLLDIVGCNDDKQGPSVKRSRIDTEGARLGKLREYMLNEITNDENQVSHPHDAISSLFISRIEQERKKASQNTVFIIDNLKHPKELTALKSVYQSSLYTVGVTDSLIRRITDKKMQFLAEEDGLEESAAVDKSVRYIVEDYLPKDYAVKVKSNVTIDVANKVGDAYFLSDFFINLNSSEFDVREGQTELNTKLKQSIERFVDLIFGAPNVTPTKQEHSMFLAYTNALRSGDLSRQVGSAIVNEIYDVMAMGANEVPTSGGGQYWADSHYVADTEENIEKLSNGVDQRDFVLGYDTNAKEKDYITDKLIDLLIENKVVAKNDRDAAINTLQNSSLKDITEYGRVVHAEMSALMSAARNGVPVQNMHMFCTTYPCHNCAKHLVAAGIRKVHYIEPYPKSKAVVSHCDSIFDPDNMNIASEINDREIVINNIVRAYLEDTLEKPKLTNDNQTSKLIFEPFSGIGPNRYVDLFSLSLSSGRSIRRKEQSQSVKLNRLLKAMPRVPTIAKHHMFYEQEFLEFMEQTVGDDFSEKCQLALSKFVNSYKLQDENRQVSKVKFWHRKYSYGYIVSDNGDNFPFNEKNLKNDDYIPKEGDEVSFIPLEGNSVIFANEIARENDTASSDNLSQTDNDQPKIEESTIQNWLSEKEYGFIDNPNGDNYYFSHSHVLSCSKDKLNKGIKVKFEAHTSEEGKLQAKKVKVII